MCVQSPEEHQGQLLAMQVEVQQAVSEAEVMGAELAKVAEVGEADVEMALKKEARSEIMQAASGDNSVGQMVTAVVQAAASDAVLQGEMTAGLAETAAEETDEEVKKLMLAADAAVQQQVVAESKMAEAEAAKDETEASKAETETAKQEAVDAQEEAAGAKRDAEAAIADAEARKAEAEAAKDETEASKAETETAKQEAVDAQEEAAGAKRDAEAAIADAEARKAEAARGEAAASVAQGGAEAAQGEAEEEAKEAQKEAEAAKQKEKDDLSAALAEETDRLKKEMEDMRNHQMSEEAHSGNMLIVVGAGFLLITGAPASPTRSPPLSRRCLLGRLCVDRKRPPAPLPFRPVSDPRCRVRSEPGLGGVPHDEQDQPDGDVAPRRHKLRGAQEQAGAGARGGGQAAEPEGAPQAPQRQPLSHVTHRARPGRERVRPGAPPCEDPHASNP